MDPEVAPPGWYPDPQYGPGMLRYWDGASWTAHTAAPNPGATPLIAAPGTQASPGSGKAIASLVLGIVGLVAWLIPLFGLPITVTGLVLGLTSMKSTRRTMAIVGAILCSIALLLTVVNAAWGFYLGATGQHPLVQWLQAQ